MSQTAAPEQQRWSVLRFRLVLAVLLCLGAFGVIHSPQAAVAAPQVFRIEGGGFGHGIGMSQYGALGYAQQGTSYPDILAHYFQQTAIQTLGQPGEVRIWLGADTTAPADMVFTPSGPTDIVVTGSGVIGQAPANKTITVTAVSGKFNVAIQDGASFNQVGGDGNNVYIAYNGNPIRLDSSGNQYKYGQIELSIPADNHLRAVLTNISMEQYLYGLGEVPSSWPADALKAQVVAARTYALEKYNRLGFIRSDCGCTLWRDVRDQNYVGWDKEIGSNGDKWVAAVNQTAGQTITYQGNPIQAFYSSSSGGHTENSENVFVQNLPYLRGVPDPYDAANGQNSLHSWSRDISFADMQNYVNSSSSTSVGTLSNVEFLNPLGVSGRVIKVNGSGGGVRITGSGGTKRVSGDSFRSVVNAASTPTKLPSSLMRIGGNGPYGNFPGGVYVAAGRLAGGDTDRIVTGADRGGGPHVRVLTATGEGTGVEFMAYDPGFKGGVRVAVCNFGDSGVKIVAAPGPSGGPHIRSFNANGTPVGNGFFAYDPGFTDGVYVACGDVDPNNPGDEIITGAGAGGGPHVGVFTKDGQKLSEFFAYGPSFHGGVRVAVAGNLIVTGAGPGGGPHVGLFTNLGVPVAGWYAYGSGFTGGVYVGGGNVTGDAAPEVISGAGESGGAHVRVFNLAGNDVGGFYAFNTGNDHGARVAAARVPGGAVVSGSGTGSPSSLSVDPV